jgi:hypothetical protein
MGNNGTSFAIIVDGNRNGSIQAAQGWWRSIAVQGRGARWAGPIQQQQQALPDGWGDNLDGIAIADSNAHWRWWN